MNTTLAREQTALLDLLHLDTIDLIALGAYSVPANGHFSLKNPEQMLRGLRAYRANAQAQCEISLQAVYPILQQLLGEENFMRLAQDFWADMPPTRGDLAQWGGDLAAYLAQVPQLQELLQDCPFLPDVARLEYALHGAATATDAMLDLQSFELFAQEDPSDLGLHLSPGCAVLRSAYPVVSIMQLHDAKFSDGHEAARWAIAEGVAQNALIWRRGFRPVFEAIDAAPAALMEATLQGQSVAFALDAALHQAGDFDLQAWLAASVQSGLLIGCGRLR